MIKMNKKLISFLCIMLAVLTVFSACSKKKKDENNKGNAQSTQENAWENIGDYEINSSAYLEILADGEHKKLVGGCFDTEKYAYYVLESKAGTSVICKYDTKDNSLKSKSATLDISGVEGICYKNNTVILLHGKTKLSVFDSARFELKETKTLLFDCCGIAYNKGADRFVLALDNGGISVMNSSFEQIFVITGIGSADKVSAITCNNKYIFTITATENGSEILVYDWDGNYVSTASVSDVRLDPVCAYVDDGVFYIGYENENGGAVYKTVLKKR